MLTGTQKAKRLSIPYELVTTFIQIWNENSLYKVSESRINCGWCYQFALIIQSIYGGQLVTSKYHSDHCWVRINGYDYDSDNLTGSLLKQKDEELMSIDETIEYWSGCGISGEVNEAVISLVILEYMNDKISKVA